VEYLTHLLHYAHYSDNKQLVISTMEVLDGFEMMQNLYDRLALHFGTAVRDQVIGNEPLPSPALHQEERARRTLDYIAIMLELLPREEVASFLNRGLRNRYTDWYKIERERFLSAGTLDDYMSLRQKSFLKTLETHFAEGSLFWTQEITAEVLEFVRHHPQISAGILDNNRVLISKIPYMTSLYLAARREADTTKMRYYGCHNPWIRGAMLDPAAEIDPIACQISCGFFKDFWEGILEQQVEVKTQEFTYPGPCNM